ncbi:hypothetical protein DQ384_05360 [Sphaerisporangium album]|uniref:SWIM-type domain-containing protein n=1 Tax=Sphaerisporangium album TaxID=509200 RepID=A0A367FNX9_9ACTN|nr:DUF6011 domain-containing protein [Sphaerisporangium album]RCG31971.1 hypothetical protein DQ384_05360 [Sphaerisporangium album]
MTTTAVDPAKCRRCHRALTSAKSIATGYGPGCAAKIRGAAKTADLTDFKPAQIAKATELIEQGGILRTRRPNLYTAVSGDGNTTYLVARQACTCPAGIKNRACYHRAALTILAAA